MKQKFIASVMCICMIFSLFAGFTTVSASEVKGEYIVQVDISRFSPEYDEAFSRNDYEKAVELADRYLDFYEEQILSVAPDAELISRTRLLLPALLIKAGKDDLAKIRSIEGVEKIYANKQYSQNEIVKSDMNVFRSASYANERLQMVGSNELIGNDEALQEKYDGRGRVLAIADSNMDPSHAVFYLSKDVKPKLTKREINNFILSNKLHVKDQSSDKSLYNSVYKSEKVPFGWNYALNKADLNPSKEQAAHGQHVSGTACGNKYYINGKIWRGVAPEAQLLMMNVMFNGVPSEVRYLKAMEDAMIMGADAVNLSLGSAKGILLDESAVRTAINKGYNSDTNFVIAAGNDGEYMGDLNIDNPDFGTISTPGIETNAITVASLENKSMYSSLLTYEGKKYMFAKAGNLEFKDGNYEFVDCGLGKPEDFEGKNLEGRIALVKRGSITFNDKVKNATANKAVGVIIYNNADGVVNMSVTGNKIPVVGVELKTGEKLISGSSKELFMNMALEEIHNPGWGELSKFTNWGLSAGGYMKPDITAPGGHIYSTQNGGNTFGDMSGTSMATPHVTGGVAVIRERLEDPIFASVLHKAALTKTILMNSAVPHVDPKTKTTTSPRRQGAGVMNLTKATELDFTAVDRDTKIASKFVGNVDDKITLNLTVHNYSHKTKRITPTVQATIEARDGKKLLLRPDELFSRTYDEKTFEVPAQGEKDFTLTFDIEHMDKVKDFSNGAFIEGYLYLRDQDAMEISFPFVSFKGNYETIPSIEKPIYDFDFDKEEPMYWNIASVYSPWHRFSTHIETNQGKTIDASGKAEDKFVLAGLKNFDDIDNARKDPNAKKPKPVFTKLSFSPNKDGFNDVFVPILVMTRTASVKAQIIKKDDGSVKLEKDYKNLVSTISNNPDDINKYSWTKGYAEKGAIDISGLEDGLYTLKFTSEALKAEKEKYPPTFTSIDFIIDKVKPEFTEARFDKDKKAFSFKLDELNDIYDLKITSKGKELTYANDGARISFSLPDGADLKDILISASDIAFNKSEYTADYILNKESYGSLDLEVNAENLDELKLVYKVYDKDGNICDDIKHLKLGKYKLKIEDYAKDYELKGEKEIDFTLTEEDRDKKITINFDKIYISKFKIHVKDMADLDASEFKVFAKNLDTNEVFELKSSDDYAKELRYGKYNVYVEFTEKRSACKASFDARMPYTINRANQVLGLRIINDDQYQIKVISTGVDPASEVKYIAKAGSMKRVIGMDVLSAGTWTIYPEKMPEGYFTTKPAQVIKLSKDNSKQSVTFDYKKINNKFTLNINDDYDKAKYEVYDFYETINKGKGAVYKYTKGMKLDPGYYIVKAIASDDAYGETKIIDADKTLTKRERKFTSEGEDVNLDFEWTILGKTDKTAKTTFKFNDGSKATSYELIIKSSAGQEYRLTLKGTKFGAKSASIDLKYDKYSMTVKNLDSNYILDKNEFTVMSEEAEIKFRTKKLNSGKIALKVNFFKGQDKVESVKYKLGLNTFTSSDIKVAPGVYTVELIEPKNLILKDMAKEYTVDSASNEINVDVLDKPQDQIDRERDAEMQKIIIKSDAPDEDLANISFKVLDNRNKEVEVEKDLDQIKFKAKKGFEYQIIAENNKYPYYPNFIKADPGEEAKTLRFAKPLTLDIKAMSKDKELSAKFKLSANTDNGRVYTEDLTKVAHLGAGKTYKVEIFDLEKGYKLKDDKVKDLVLESGYEYKLVYECELDLSLVAADKAELQRLVDKYEEVLASKKYINATDEEKSEYQSAIVEADRCLAKQDLNQEEANKAVKAIKDAYEKLSGVENPLEKTNPVELEDAYINDKFVKGKGVAGASVYYKVVEKGQNPDDVKVKSAMLISESGSFSIEVAKIQDDIEIYVYQKENNKLMSDGVKLNVLALDKTELEKLIDKAIGLESGEQYKRADAEAQKNLIDTRVAAEKVLSDPDANREDINNAETELKLAIAAIENVEIKYFTVRFVYANGAADDEVKVIEGEKAIRPEDPKRDGYKFKGWYEDKELTKEFDFTKPIDKNTDVYAKWEEIIMYEITFDPNNGEATWTETVRQGEKVKEPAKPVKLNHTFIAWQFNGENYNFATSVMSNIKLIAAWEENKVEPQPEPLPNIPDVKPYEPEPRPYRPVKPTPKPQPKPVEEKKEETKPVETKPVETKPVENKEHGIITEYPTSPVKQVELKDVPKGPEGDAIRNLVSYGIIKGTGKGKFEGKKTINRAMVTRVFMLISKDKTAEDALNFTDVKDTAWYAESVKWAATKNIIAGYKDGTFKAEKKVTRQEFCVMLAKLLKVSGIELKSIVPVNEADFTSVAAWSRQAIIEMKKAGLVNVDASGKFGPESEFTREELAKTIDLLIKLLRLSH